MPPKKQLSEIKRAQIVALSELAAELREGLNKKHISSKSEKKVIRSGIKRMQSQEEAILVSGQQEKTTGICKKT